MIAGRTHPDVARREGERYRLSLEQAVLDLGLEDHVEFDDRFLSDRRDRRPARDDRRLRDPVPRARADLLRSAHLRDRRRLRRRLDAVLVRGGHARRRVPARSCRSPIPRRSPTPSAATSRSRKRLVAARPEARRIGAELAWPSVAEATAAVLREAVELAPRRRLGAGIDQRLVSIRTDHLRTLVDDVGIVQHANGVIPNRATRVLRRRCRAARRRCARALAPGRRAGLDVDRLPLARVPPGRDGPRGGHAELHGLRPPLARRAAPRRPRRPLGLGARRDPLDGLGPRRRRPHRTAARDDHRHLVPEASLRTGAYAALGLARLDPDRLAARRPGSCSSA